MATLVFEPALVSSSEFEKLSFPIPPCLIGVDGLLKAEFFVTLAYEPPLNPGALIEYCRSNIDVSLGTYEPDKHGVLRHFCEVPSLPTDLTKLYERDQIEHGYKWSPLKVYHRRMPRGIKAGNWRLSVSIHHRKGDTYDTAQKLALIISIADPKREAPVYNQVSSLIVARGWNTADLRVEPRVRIKN